MVSIPGIHTEEGLRRAHGSAALYIRFLKRFPDDPSFESLTNALSDGRLCDAYLHAHTLKGLAAQLGITALHVPLAALCDALKSGSPEVLPSAQAQLNQLAPVYWDIVRQILALP